MLRAAPGCPLVPSACGLRVRWSCRLLPVVPLMADAAQIHGRLCESAATGSVSPPRAARDLPVVRTQAFVHPSGCSGGRDRQACATRLRWSLPLTASFCSRQRVGIFLTRQLCRGRAMVVWKQAVAWLIVPQQLFGYRNLVHLRWAVCKTHLKGTQNVSREGHFLGYAHRAMHMQRAGGNVM